MLSFRKCICPPKKSVQKEINFKFAIFFFPWRKKRIEKKFREEINFNVFVLHVHLRSAETQRGGEIAYSRKNYMNKFQPLCSSAQCTDCVCVRERECVRESVSERVCVCARAFVCLSLSLYVCVQTREYVSNQNMGRLDKLGRSLPALAKIKSIIHRLQNIKKKLMEKPATPRQTWPQPP